MPHWLTVTDCRAVLLDLVRAELSAYRGSTIPDGQKPPELDSLERLHLAGCVNEFFRLHETGAEDRLLMTNSLDEWATLVAAAISTTSGLTFRTSGSTGSPTSHLHSWQHIEAEAAALAECLAAKRPIQRVVSWLPLHHLYGFMVAVALPACAGIPRNYGSNQALPELRSGDLLVTVPPRWDFLARSGKTWPAQVLGVSSTGPLADTTVASLLQHDLTGLLDIYGSTETGGIATRWWPESSYQLLAHWQRLDSQHIKRRGDTSGTPLMDQLHWLSECTFQLHGRLDDVISIGGINVSPTRVAERLRALSSVQECAVRPTGPDAQRRLKAFVVPAVDPAIAEQDIANTIALWPAAERPINITYGDVIPTNAIGKRTDW
ncbi:AMP-binding protein [Alkalimonas amylolytica]|uniref:4-coumarate--CoA ligase n=1 Tax=Alkalimonas amylolytica TaxID=152573 RepID=A0A1H3XYU4_ALKAM|nr:AMP-binding protein [Alkalimonas amylolytica]SEA04546.1 4-coumarate--CoA ligase [Alkalimonas amylolytica]